MLLETEGQKPLKYGTFNGSITLSSDMSKNPVSFFFFLSLSFFRLFVCVNVDWRALSYVAETK